MVVYKLYYSSTSVSDETIVLWYIYLVSSRYPGGAGTITFLCRT